MNNERTTLFNDERQPAELDTLFDQTARLAVEYRQSVQHDSPYPESSLGQLRAAFGFALSEEGMEGVEVIKRLSAAAQPGLVGSTGNRFYGWVIGASHPVGAAADWLCATWGQNAGIYECSPAAAVAEERAAQMLLDLLDLPRESSVGFVTGATMAGFTCLAAARWRQLERHGFDLDRDGMSGCPQIGIFVGEEAHSTIYHALRLLGFGERDLKRIPSDTQGRMIVDCLEAALQEFDGPAIVIAQAGHINSGAFDDLPAISRTAQARGAWLHVDGAFGLWAQACPELRFRTTGIELADSWSVDGHKLLQVPYDSGYAIVRDEAAHRHAMQINASYLGRSDEARDPSNFVPELSRRARGFATWAVIHALGRKGIAELVVNQHRAAVALAKSIGKLGPYEVMNEVVFNQIAIALRPKADRSGSIAEVARRMAEIGRFFVKTAHWNGRDILRISIGGPAPTPAQQNELVRLLDSAHPHIE